MTEPLTAVDTDALRHGWGRKWGGLDASVLPAWIAEADAAVVPSVRDAVSTMVEHDEFGYPPADAVAQLAEAFAAHVAARHGWAMDPTDVVAFTDVVQPVSFAIDRLTSVGDPVMIHAPYFGALAGEITGLGRHCWTLPWERTPDGWASSIDHVVAGCDAGARVMLLVNPHNPTGRAWTRAELDALADVVVERNLIVVADEMFADLALDPAVHVPFASLGAEVATRTLTVTSAAKSHGLGGVRCAVAHLGPGLHLEPMRRLPEAQIGQVSNLGLRATIAAWRDGDEWLDSFRTAIRARRDQAMASLAEHLPAVDVVAPEAGFMLWIDCRPLGLPGSPAAFFAQRARVVAADGDEFGPGGDGFIRLTIATSSELLSEMLERMVTAVDLWAARR